MRLARCLGGAVLLLASASAALGAPHWIREASGEEMDAAFPARATSAGVTSGMAALDCQVTPEGALTRCRVNQESPAGMGFGEAALRVAPDFRLAPRIGRQAPANLVLQWWKRR